MIKIINDKEVVRTSPPFIRGHVFTFPSFEEQEKHRQDNPDLYKIGATAIYRPISLVYNGTLDEDHLVGTPQSAAIWMGEMLDAYLKDKGLWTE